MFGFVYLLYMALHLFEVLKKKIIFSLSWTVKWSLRIMFDLAPHSPLTSRWIILVKTFFLLLFFFFCSYFYLALWGKERGHWHTSIISAVKKWDTVLSALLVYNSQHVVVGLISVFLWMGIFIFCSWECAKCQNNQQLCSSAVISLCPSAHA